MKTVLLLAVFTAAWCGCGKLLDNWQHDLGLTMIGGFSLALIITAIVATILGDEKARP